jgi:hypothetical protein
METSQDLPSAQEEWVPDSASRDKEGVLEAMSAATSLHWFSIPSVIRRSRAQQLQPTAYQGKTVIPRPHSICAL